jgi:hypothetical protein
MVNKLMSEHSTRSIPGAKAAANWQALHVRLLADEPAAWDEAFNSFCERLRPRYLEPIQILQESGRFKGEGFSIVAIQCSLVEFLESTIQGINYHHQSRGKYEYRKSQKVFVAFLENRTPFSNTFKNGSALDFYIGVRCGLMHEAQTKNGWRIKANGTAGAVADIAGKIIYRNNFQKALHQFIDQYGIDLKKNPDLKQAFIRKFNALYV